MPPGSSELLKMAGFPPFSRMNNTPLYLTQHLLCSFLHSWTQVVLAAVNNAGAALLSLGSSESLRRNVDAHDILRKRSQKRGCKESRIIERGNS